MNLLLDTHTFLWFVDGSSRLSSRARELIEHEGNTSLLSIASLWEMAIKISLGKLVSEQPFQEFMLKQIADNGFGSAHIRIDHIAEVVSLPFHHRDPFDRMLIAQCVVDDLSIVSADSIFDKYPVHRLW